MDYGKIQSLHKAEDIFDLRERVALITGGAGKLGREFARTLAFAGADLIISDLDLESCKGLAAEIASETNRRTMGMTCDVSAEDQVRTLFAQIDHGFGRLDILIANVMAKPADYYRGFEDYPLETWNTVIGANLTGAFLCCREAASLMKRTGGGSIILTSSIYGLVGPDQRIYSGCQPISNPYGGRHPLNAPGAYAASKGGLIAFARYLATLWAAVGTRVNVLIPGGVYDGQEDAFHEEYVKRTPLGRMAVWSDYNGAILFLASEASRYMTGASLVVDGGWTAW